jgi:hypothetical protein
MHLSGLVLVMSCYIGSGFKLTVAQSCAVRIGMTVLHLHGNCNFILIEALLYHCAVFSVRHCLPNTWSLLVILAYTGSVFCSLNCCCGWLLGIVRFIWLLQVNTEICRLAGNGCCGCFVPFMLTFHDVWYFEATDHFLAILWSTFIS